MRMASLTIIEYFNVLENIGLSLGAATIVLMIHELCLECRKGVRFIFRKIK